MNHVASRCGVAATLALNMLTRVSLPSLGCGSVHSAYCWIQAFSSDALTVTP